MILAPIFRLYECTVTCYSF